MTWGDSRVERVKGVAWKIDWGMDRDGFDAPGP